MHLSASFKPNRLPRRFPVGATYVVEGCGGAEGQLRVFSRYVVLPDGRRINLADDFRGPASPRVRRRTRSRGENQAQNRGKTRSARRKKIMAGGGTTRQHRR
jgi:hypothetical protein